MVLAYFIAMVAVVSANRLHYIGSSPIQLLLCYVFLVLTINVLHTVILDIRNYIVAYNKNATVVPIRKSRLPFAIDIFYREITSQGKIVPGALAMPYFIKHKTKTFNGRVLMSDAYITMDPLVVKHILTAGSFQNYGKGPKFQYALKDLLGNGIFNSDPDSVWKFHRSLTKPFFHKERITDFKLDHIDRMVKVMDTLSADPINCQDIFRRWTFDSSVDFLFGYQTNGLDELVEGDGTSGDFARAFDAATYTSLKFFILGKMKLVYEGIYGAMSKQLAIISPLVDRVVYEALVRQSENKASNEKESNPEEFTNVLDYLVTQTHDRETIKNELLNLLLAGRDTTSALLTSLFYEFSRNPDVYSQTREEILRTFGEDGEPDYRIMRDSRFLRALINETLRLYPPVPINTRYSFKDDIITTSEDKIIFIPGSSTIVYNIWDLHRSTELWGPDAVTWDPTRWLDERVEFMTKNPFIFQPFSAGPRLCLGQQHAYNQATLALIRICQHFKHVELTKDQHEYLPTAQLTLHWKDGMHLRFKKA